jgi:hypothetical protein
MSRSVALAFLTTFFFLVSAAERPVSGMDVVIEDPVVPIELADRYLVARWRLLAGWDYEYPEIGALAGLGEEELRRRSEKIPQPVRDLDGREVAIRGFVVPVDVERGEVRRFLVVSKFDLGCCFGAGMGVNEWILAEAPKGRKLAVPDDFSPATVLGRLAVGEEIEEGTLMSLYRMEAHEVRDAGGAP